MSEVYLENAPAAARIQHIQYRAFNGKSSNLTRTPNTRGKFVNIKDIDFNNMPLGEMLVIRPTAWAGQVHIFNGWLDMPLLLGDIIYNGRDVITTLEFFIGGKVTIGSENVVLVNSQRSVRQYSTTDEASPKDVARAIFEVFRELIIYKNREDGMKTTGGLGIRG
jgi:hypothetical protein